MSVNDSFVVQAPANFWSVRTPSTVSGKMFHIATNNAAIDCGKEQSNQKFPNLADEQRGNGSSRQYDGRHSELR